VKRERGAIGLTLLVAKINSVAVSATVDGEQAHQSHWETGKAEPAHLIRKPGDLPSSRPLTVGTAGQNGTTRAGDNYAACGSYRIFPNQITP
jgi:hypothetical protein